MYCLKFLNNVFWNFINHIRIPRWYFVFGNILEILVQVVNFLCGKFRTAILQWLCKGYLIWFHCSYIFLSKILFSVSNFYTVSFRQYPKNLYGYFVQIYFFLKFFLSNTLQVTVNDILMICNVLWVEWLKIWVWLPNYK